MNTEITNAVVASDDKAQYDEKVKRLLGHKSILAHILVHTVDEFQGMDPKVFEPFCFTVFTLFLYSVLRLVLHSPYATFLQRFLIFYLVPALP